MDALALPFADSNFIPLGLRTGIGRGGHDPVVVVDPHVNAEKGHDLGPLGRSVIHDPFPLKNDGTTRGTKTIYVIFAIQIIKRSGLVVLLILFMLVYVIKMQIFFVLLMLLNIT